MAVKCGHSVGLFNQYIAALAACLSVVNSSACCGWITPILDYLLGPDSEIPMTSAQTSWVIPIIELGNFITPLPAGILSDYIGRKPIILATGPLYIVSWLLIVFYPSVTMLGAARLLQGLTMGLTFTAAPVYLGEIASKENRGAITSMFFNSWWLGFLIQYAMGSFLSFHKYTYFTLYLNIPFMLLFFWQPESPYYHVMCGDIEKARSSLTRFRDATVDELQIELEEIKLSVEANQRSAGFRDLITSSEGRKALTILLMLTGANILSGTGAITVYATQIFDKTPNLSIPPYAVTIVLGIVMLVGGVISSFTSDSVGRRPLLIISCIGTFISQFIAGTYYFLLFNTTLEISSFSWIAPVLILIYSGLCTAGMYPLCSVYTSELFNSNTRGIASSICAICVTLFTLISLVLYKPVNDYLGLYANFYIYSLTILVGGTYCYLNAPETKGKSFVEIREELIKFKH
ncbi:facilitated trehalose transporter Tret1-like isoform X2 [Homalodisca vitripennis]|nr:facilitated trehalose transporter Tret1-like isoform X2 [Homalodisca vitripennis]XP_046669411.1 facilitated trehalose transporter Tret1-like isoform X2 [Homalodisca vitripennis]